MQPLFVCHTQACRSGVVVCDHPKVPEWVKPYKPEKPSLRLVQDNTRGLLSGGLVAERASSGFAEGLRRNRTASENEMDEIYYGRQIKVRTSDLKPISLYASQSEPRRVVQSLMNCDHPDIRKFERSVSAFVSQYGFPTDKGQEIDGFAYYPLMWVKKLIAYLRRFADACRAGDGPLIQEMIVEKWSEQSKAIYFEPRLDPASRRLIPEIVVPSLFHFCIQELLTLYFDGQTMSTCAHCGTMSFSEGRADKRYCSTRCRTAASRLRNRDAVPKV